MHYIVYQTTNLINGKIYRGKHQTSDLNDRYLGSGNQIRRAIKKYGIENFQREILYQFDNEADMISKEAELVTEDFCNLSNTYNICPGGKGGFGYINQNNLTPRRFGFTEEERAKSIIATKLKVQSNSAHRQALADRAKKNLGYDSTGSHLSDDHKRKIGEANSLHQQGEKNSQFGSMWITNGTENRKIKKLDQIPEGWYKGRKLGVSFRKG